jgi:hypothetical protein
MKFSLETNWFDSGVDPGTSKKQGIQEHEHDHQNKQGITHVYKVEEGDPTVGNGKEDMPRLVIWK